MGHAAAPAGLLDHPISVSHFHVRVRTLCRIQCISIQKTIVKNEINTFENDSMHIPIAYSYNHTPYHTQPPSTPYTIQGVRTNPSMLHLPIPRVMTFRCCQSHKTPPV